MYLFILQRKIYGDFRVDAITDSSSVCDGMRCDAIRWLLNATSSFGSWVAGSAEHMMSVNYTQAKPLTRFE